MKRDPAFRSLRTCAAALVLGLAAATYAAPAAHAACPVIGGPNANPYGSRAQSFRLCQEDKDNAAAQLASPAGPQFARASGYRQQAPEASQEQASVARPIVGSPNASSDRTGSPQ